MEEVYVVKLKSRPETSSLYPSERRYSASTVGGLGLVHLLLAATLLVLATLGMASEEAESRGRYAGAVALGLAAGVAAGVAILAWRRWYVDNNIRHFLVASSIAGVVALVCLGLTALSLASVQEEISARHFQSRLVPTTPLNATDADVQTPLVDAPTPAFDATAPNLDHDDMSEEVNDSLPVTSSENGTHFEARSGGQWIYDYERFQEIRNVVLVNVLVASALELAWCVLSIRLAWRGVNNVYTDGDEAGLSQGTIRNTYLPDAKRLRSPDIIHNLAVNVVSNEMDHYLPKGESTREYEDRVRRFLASNDGVDVVVKH